MIIRIGKIPYLNSEVFFTHLEFQDRLEMVPLVPSALSRAALGGEIDAGPFPLVTCFDLADRFKPLGDFCIATRDKARSILLFSKRPIENLSGASIAVTSETSTSVRLLKVLLSKKIGVTPGGYVSTGDSNDAFLLIGDEALRKRKGVPLYSHIYDLGEIWNEWTGLPFVFARWGVREDVPGPIVTRFVGALEKALAAGLGNIDEIAGRRGEDLGMTKKEVCEYIGGFRYTLGEAEKTVIERFKELDTEVRISEESKRASHLG